MSETRTVEVFEPVTLEVAPGRTETFLGRSFQVYPAVLVRSQVLRNNLGTTFLPPDAINQDWANQWNGIPVLIGDHPKDDEGTAVTGRTIQEWDARLAGYIFNAKVKEISENERSLIGEVWFDIERVDQVRGFQAVLDQVGNGQPVELSTGFTTEVVPLIGNYNGEPYQMIMQPDKPDHLVISTEFTGACSCADGCGLGVNKFTGDQPATNDTPMQSVDGTGHPASDFAYVPDPSKSSTWKFPIFDAAHVRNAIARFGQADIPASAKSGAWAKITKAARKYGVDVSPDSGPHGNNTEAKPSMWDRIKSRFTTERSKIDNEIAAKFAIPAANQASVSDDDKRRALTNALQDRFKDAGDVIVQDVYSSDSVVVFWLVTPFGSQPKGPEYFRLGYTEGEGGTFTFAEGDPEKVQRVTVYEPVGNTAGEPSPKAAATNCSCGTKQEEATMSDTNKSTVETQLASIADAVAALSKTVGNLATEVGSLKDAAKADPNPSIAGLKRTIGELSEKVEGMATVTQTAVQEKERERKSLVAELSGNFRCSFTEAELEAKPLSELQKLAEMLETSFSGKGGKRSASNTADRNEQTFMEPIPYWMVKKEGK